MATETEQTFFFPKKINEQPTGTCKCAQHHQVIREMQIKATKLTHHTCQNVVVQLLSCVQLFVIPWTVGHQVPLSMGFPRQEYWSRLQFPSPEDLPNPGVEPISPALASGFFIAEPPGKPICQNAIINIVSDKQCR